MGKLDGNDPAFAIDVKNWILTTEQLEKHPGLENDLRRIVIRSQGLTKREWFAGLAMQGLIKDSESPFLHAEVISEKAVKQADALIAELAKQTK